MDRGVIGAIGETIAAVVRVGYAQAGSREGRHEEA
jgi:hypothetical protein